MSLLAAIVATTMALANAPSTETLLRLEVEAEISSMALAVSEQALGVFDKSMLLTRELKDLRDDELTAEGYWNRYWLARRLYGADAPIVKKMLTKGYSIAEFEARYAQMEILYAKRHYAGIIAEGEALLALPDVPDKPRVYGKIYLMRSHRRLGQLDKAKALASELQKEDLEEVFRCEVSRVLETR